MKKTILKDYEASKQNLDSFKDIMKNLLQNLLNQATIPIHQISSRTKDFDSLSKKIDKKQSEGGGEYRSLHEITDLVGIRIITYLESDIDKVAALINKEFKIDDKNSIDKRRQRTDQFSYRSLHIVISLSNTRSALTEYKAYENLKCEIQIRSILQHAWAEIEHDLGYKSKVSIPEISERSFNRLSALLETADIEFDRLKNELTEYENNVSQLIKENPEEVAIDQASLVSFLHTNIVLNEAINVITHITGAEIYSNNDFQGIISRFNLFGIKTIKELDESLSSNKEVFLVFISEFLVTSKHAKLPSSVPLFYYQHFLASKQKSIDFVEIYLRYGPNIIGNNNTAERFISVYEKALEKINNKKT
jgi:ppGpp synthetase/RelA/SpoT-type nucleotidyltranferase